MHKKVAILSINPEGRFPDQKLDLIKKWKRGSNMSIMESKEIIEQLLSGENRVVYLTPNEICDLSHQGFKFIDEKKDEDNMNTKHYVRFSNVEVVAMAKFLAAIVKEGLTYSIVEDIGGWEVHLLGGY
jgi:hypothetical protein